MRSTRRAASKLRWVLRSYRVPTVRPSGPSVGRALLSYMSGALLVARRDGAMPTGHTHFWETWAMAQTLRDLGFVVDVVHFHNRLFRPRGRYDLVIDVRWNLERWAPELDEHCVKVMHIDTAHTLFQNAAEMRRLLELQQRRGVTLQPRHNEPLNHAIEHADAATILGNDFTESTFAFAGKPLHRVPVATARTYDWPQERDVEVARKRFLWLGSRGLVHKGLDLVLEVFARNPDLHLTVCGPIEGEPDFVAAYGRELYETSNIETRGWIDVTGPEFEALATRTIALVYPSCSEGQAGSVATCMQAGLVPVCSYETGIDLGPDFGVILADSSIAAVEAAVRDLSQRGLGELESMARGAWEQARSHHTREAFVSRYRDAMRTILADHGVPTDERG